MVQELLAGTVRAPEFPAGPEWLNTDRPLTLAEFRGKVVVLDFWTYCCINCMHVLPDLKRLERKYPDTLVVIGVHSGKFGAEHETENIREAILRYGITHPVINDAEYEVWRSYAVRAWPTLMIVNPRGRVIGAVSGEGNYDLLDQIVSQCIEEFGQEGDITPAPLPLHLERQSMTPQPLAFPGKVLADEDGGRLFITDSSHHRIIVTDLATGQVRRVYGMAHAGLVDGPPARAQFREPQGLALVGDTLYVADTGNHAIRAIDLTTGETALVAGTGMQNRHRLTRGPAQSTALNSPWDVLWHEGMLYIAMAGSHQLWRYDPEAGEVSLFAGTGAEGLHDAPRSEAALAQPSGLATDGQRLYFADSETSSIRAVDLAGGAVTTLIGAGLFEFGDVDGPIAQARLQHCLGVLHHDGALYIADTYNNKVKRLDLAAGRVETLIGTGEAGATEGTLAGARLNEPGGLSAAGGRLYVADTNNHRIAVADPASGQLTTYPITGLPAIEHGEHSDDVVCEGGVCYPAALHG